MTQGEPVLTDVISTASHTEEEVLRMAAIAEKGSEHPLGEAIVKGAAARNINVPDATSFKAIAGHGVEAGFGGKTDTSGHT